MPMIPLLEELDLPFGSIKDVSPLSQCKGLKKINIRGNKGIEVLSPLCQCPDLKKLNICGLILIKDLCFFERGFTKLRVLDISCLPVDDLSPLARLQNLEELDCRRIPVTTSLLPLARCYKLKAIHCLDGAMDLEKVKEKRPDLIIIIIIR